MARIAGINIPSNKRVEIALTYIHGIGRTTALDITQKLEIDRTRRVQDLTDQEVLHIRETIDEAILAGGSSLRDHRQTDGRLGYFQHRFAVYDREGEPCPRDGCRGIVARIVQSGRSTFHCPVCQR